MIIVIIWCRGRHTATHSDRLFLDGSMLEGVVDGCNWWLDRIGTLSRRFIYVCGVYIVGTFDLGREKN